MGKPAHYHVAPDNIDTRTVIKCFYWGTHVGVTAHRSYGTKSYTKGASFSGNHRYLGRSGNNVKATGCSLRVIFRRHGHHHVHNNQLQCATRTAASNNTGIGPGHVTCYNQHCRTTVGSLQCTTRSTYFAGSGVRVATLPGGYTMTGGGIYNHY